MTEEVQEATLPLPAQRAKVNSGRGVYLFSVELPVPLTADEWAECVRALANAKKEHPELLGFSVSLEDGLLFVSCTDTLEAVADTWQVLRTIFAFEVPHAAWSNASQVMSTTCRVNLRLVDDSLYSDGTVDSLIAALKAHEEVLNVALSGEKVEVLVQGQLDEETDRDRIQQMFDDLGVAVEIAEPQSLYHALFG